MFSVKNLPLIRILFMNHFSYQRFAASLMLMVGFAELRKKVLYRWHLDKLAEKSEIRLAQAQTKASRWADSLSWRYEGQLKALYDIEEQTAMLAFVANEDIEALVGEAQQLGQAALVACCKQNAQRDSAPGIYLCTLTEGQAPPPGSFYGMVVNQDSIKVIHEATGVTKSQFKGVMKSMKKKLDRFTP